MGCGRMNQLSSSILQTKKKVGKPLIDVNCLALYITQPNYRLQKYLNFVKEDISID